MGAILKMKWSITKQLREVDCERDAQHKGQKTIEEFAKMIGKFQNFQKIKLL